MTTPTDVADLEDAQLKLGEPPTLDCPHTGPVAVVGIGASAGGLKAITALLAMVPVASGLAMVVIQHRTPNEEWLMVDLLTKVTPLLVRIAEEGMKLEANHVYIAPAGKILTLVQGRFAVGKQTTGGALPID